MEKQEHYIYSKTPSELYQILIARFEQIDKRMAEEKMPEIEVIVADDEKVDLKDKVSRLEQQNAALEKENANLLKSIKEKELRDTISDTHKNNYDADQSTLLKQGVIKLLNRVVEKLDQTDYIISCNGNTREVQVMEDNIRNGAKNTLRKLTELNVSGLDIISVHASIQKFFLKEMESISSWIRKLAIYSSYVNIPFMIDEGRTDGIRFNREATMWAYALLDDMLASVGIKQIVPAPFIELISDGEYEDVSDSATMNIGSFCPDYRERLERIDRIDVCGLVLDIAEVGLMIDGKLFRKAKVII